MKYWDTFIKAYQNYASYLWHEITNPGLFNYFYALIFVSLFFFTLELVKPWRTSQAILRKDFWLDFFYMFFNFFLFSLIIYNAASDVIVFAFNDVISWLTGFDLQASNPLRKWPLWSILIIGFIIRDFVQWWIHRLLHRFDFLWQFHQVHHSVEEMGFAAHLRFHWMENVVYRSLEYLPLALLGIGLYDFFIIHIFTLAWGHYNHSNISLNGKITGGAVGALIGAAIAFSWFDIGLLIGAATGIQIAAIGICTLIGVFVLGPIMKYVFNSPEMHIWHHTYTLPESREMGINFGLTLAIWDYIFGTAAIPHDGKDIRLGFPGINEFPQSFVKQVALGFNKKDFDAANYNRTEEEPKLTK